MSSQPIQYEEREDSLSSVQGELLQALLQSEEEVYPWNPAEPEVEAFFAELERGFFLDYCQEEEEIKYSSQALFDSLQKCWSSPTVSEGESLSRSLSERFAAIVPTVWLEAIANKALQVFPSNLSLVDQLVQCVQPLLPNWHEEDLLLLARPVAYAMRGNSQNVVQPVEWSSLSQMEQVRLSLVVANSALTQLQHSTENPKI